MNQSPVSHSAFVSLLLLSSGSCLMTPLCCWHHWPTSHAFVCPNQAPTPEPSRIIFIRPLPTQEPCSLRHSLHCLGPHQLLTHFSPSCHHIACYLAIATSSMYSLRSNPRPSCLGPEVIQLFPCYPWSASLQGMYSPLGWLSWVVPVLACVWLLFQVLGPTTTRQSKSHSHRAHLAVEETAHKQVNQPTKALQFHVVVSAVKYVRKVWTVDG